eukprot:COSAG05_NODE_1901_length_3856_cov_3.807559_2_plen_41_part_00
MDTEVLVFSGFVWGFAVSSSFEGGKFNLVIGCGWLIQRKL